jgi:hypothetical protein
MALGILRSLAESVEDPDRVLCDVHCTADEPRSLAVSFREAAFRRDIAFFRIYRVEITRQARLLAELIKDVAPIAGEAVRK